MKIRSGKNPHLGLWTPPRGIVVPSFGGFDPLTVSGLAAWYDFSDAATLFTDTGRTTAVSADGNSIKGVTDKSGSGNHLAEATAPPTYKTGIQNGRSVARFVAASSQHIGVTGLSIATPQTVVLVWSATVGASRSVLSATASPDGIQLNSDLNTQWVGGASNMYYLPQTLTCHTDAWIINSTSSQVYMNGGSAAATGDAGTATFDRVDLGIRSAFFDGDFMEVLVWGKVLSLAELNYIGSGLAGKWGFTWTTAT